MAKRRFAEVLADGLKGLPFPGLGGAAGGAEATPWGWWHPLPGATFDYKREAGLLWESGVVLPLIKWAGRTFPEAPIIVDELRGGEYEVVDGHPAALLFETPNPYYDSSVMVSGILLSLMTDGNCYLYKLRSAAGKTVGLIYIPHWRMGPRWKLDGSEFISAYEYRVDGKSTFYKPEEIIHLRDGIDPVNDRLGLSPLSALLREVCTDNEASTFMAALLRNAGVAGAVLSPDLPDGEISPEMAVRFKEQWRESFRGDKRGEVLVSSLALKVEQPGWTPEQLVLDKVRTIPESRICAAIGIPAQVVGYSAGDDTKTYANMKEAREAAYEQFMIPTYRTICSQMRRQLPELFAPNQRLRPDLSQVRVLQDDEDKLFSRLTKAAGRPIITVNEARKAIGKDPVPEGDELYVPSAKGQQPDGEPSDDEKAKASAAS